MLQPLHAKDSPIRAFLPRDFLTTIVNRAPEVREGPSTKAWP